MDLLESLLADPNVPSNTVSNDKEIDNTIKVLEEEKESWITTAHTDSSSTEKHKLELELWDTKIVEVHPSKLIWAKNNYYSSKKCNNTASNHFPARICEEHEGAYLHLETWPIPDDELLVEFLGLPKKDPITPQKMVVKKEYCVPYYEDVHHNNSSHLRKQQLSILSFTTLSSKEGKDPKRMWNINSCNNMIEFLRFHYNKERARAIDEHILAKAYAFLEVSLKRADIARAAQAQSLSRAPHADGEDESSSGCSDSEDSIDLAKFARQDPTLMQEKDVLIGPNTWISYTHKVFKIVMHTRVVEVKARRHAIRLVVENGEILEKEDKVRVMGTKSDGSCDMEAGYGGYKPLGSYKFKKGKSQVLRNLHERIEQEFAHHKLDLGSKRTVVQGSPISKRTKTFHEQAEKAETVHGAG